jgi:hypothetical protein
MITILLIIIVVELSLTIVILNEVYRLIDRSADER